MLAIWSRARANPGTCRCISRVSNTAAVARRGGRTVLRGSWPFGTPTSTFVYTAVFAAGLSVDTRAKVARNKQWEQAFAHLDTALERQLSREGAKETEAATERVHQPHYHGLSFADLPRDFDWEGMQRIVGMELRFEVPRRRVTGMAGQHRSRYRAL
jgi:hypothetical protein